MHLRPLTITDIPLVVSLHRECLGYTLSSRIGEHYLSVLYTSLLSDQAATLFVAEEKNQIIGVVSATNDLRQTSHHLPKFWVAPYIIRALLKGSIHVKELWDQLRFEQYLLATFLSPYATILTLFVAPSVQKKGVGTQLVNTIKKFYQKERNYLYVDTGTTNSGGQRFYERSGATEVARQFNSVVYKWDINI